MENYIGRLLDNRYEILEVIGTGGMAVVYKARCHRLNRFVAIKILKDEFSQDAEFRRRFHAESQAVAMLSHPNIVSVYDVSHSDNVDYIVMELIDGISLKQYMEQKGTLNWREALHFSTQIAKALEHAHSRGIIHRDIKPHNIMILKDGSVKVADFGIARVSSAQSTLTREALGSVHYISPEQAKGGKIDYRSDLYSLGVVMYEMLTGRPPYDGETPVSVAIQHINAKAVRPRDWNPQIPIGLEQITMHAMTANLDERYESATEMLHDLDEFRKNPSITFDFSEIPTASRPMERSTARTAAERAVRSKSEQQRRSTPEPRKKNHSNSVALIAGIICIAVALFAIGYFLYSFFFADLFSVTEDVQVPNFVNEYAESINSRDYPDFIIHIDEWVNDEMVEKGRVISQNPSANRIVKVGSTIELTVSLGPSTDTMRDLINYTVDNAMTILDNLGLNLQISIDYESSDVVQEKSVIRTIPSKDEQLSYGQKVTLVVSSGPEVRPVSVPQLLTMEISKAMETLDRLNLKYNVTRVDSDEPKDTVIYQSISQGEPVKEGTTIDLEVSNGPADDETPEENEADNPEDPDLPALPQSHVVKIPVPTEGDVIEITIRVDGELDQTLPPLDLETVVNNEIPITLEGQGIHLVDIYVDDILWYSMIFNFDTGEVVE